MIRLLIGLGLNIFSLILLQADCIGDFAINTTLKLLNNRQRFEDIPMGFSSLNAKNPFPDPWRWAAAQVDTLPVLNDMSAEDLARALHRQLATDLTGQELLAQLVVNSADPVTLIVTGRKARSGHPSGHSVSSHVSLNEPLTDQVPDYQRTRSLTINLSLSRSP